MRLFALDVLLGRVPEDRRFFLDVKLFGIPSVVNETLKTIKNRWPGCEGVSVCFDPGFPIDPGIEEEQFRLEVTPLYGDRAMTTHLEEAIKTVNDSPDVLSTTFMADGRQVTLSLRIHTPEGRAVRAILQDAEEIIAERNALQARIKALEKAIETIYNSRCERTVVMAVCEEVME